MTVTIKNKGASLLTAVLCRTKCFLILHKWRDITTETARVTYCKNCWLYKSETGWHQTKSGGEK